MAKLTIKEAEAQGYNVDTRCYPHVGYIGDRFMPGEHVKVFTEIEGDLLEACLIGDSLGNCGPALLENAADLLNYFAPITAKELRRKATAERAAIAKARGTENG